MSRCITLLTAGVLAIVAPCRSQSPLVHHPLDSGRVVRLHPFSGPPETGRLTAPFAPDSTKLRYCLYYAPPCQPVPSVTWRERPAADIARIEIKVGSRAGRGFLIGTASCGVVWAFVSPVYGWPDNPLDFLVNFIGGAIISAPTCGGMGALIGAQKPVWGPLPD